MTKNKIHTNNNGTKAWYINGEKILCTSQTGFIKTLFHNSEIKKNMLDPNMPILMAGHLQYRTIKERRLL